MSGPTGRRLGLHVADYLRLCACRQCSGGPDQEPTGTSIGRNGLYWILACTDPTYELVTDVY